jgi:hypothetical protein
MCRPVYCPPGVYSRRHSSSPTLKSLTLRHLPIAGDRRCQPIVGVDSASHHEQSRRRLHRRHRRARGCGPRPFSGCARKSSTPGICGRAGQWCAWLHSVLRRPRVLERVREDRGGTDPTPECDPCQCGIRSRPAVPCAYPLPCTSEEQSCTSSNGVASLSALSSI